MTKLSMAEDQFRAAGVVLFYDWGFIPLCNLFGLPALTPTNYGLFLLAAAGLSLACRWMFRPAC